MICNFAVKLDCRSLQLLGRTCSRMHAIALDIVRLQYGALSEILFKNEYVNDFAREYFEVKILTMKYIFSSIIEGAIKVDVLDQGPCAYRITCGNNTLTIGANGYYFQGVDINITKDITCKYVMVNDFKTKRLCFLTMDKFTISAIISDEGTTTDIVFHYMDDEVDKMWPLPMNGMFSLKFLPALKDGELPYPNPALYTNDELVILGVATPEQYRINYCKYLNK